MARICFSGVVMQVIIVASTIERNSAVVLDRLNVTWRVVVDRSTVRHGSRIDLFNVTCPPRTSGVGATRYMSVDPSTFEWSAFRMIDASGCRNLPESIGFRYDATLKEFSAILVQR
jgi:hypothetical protein